MNNLVYPVIQQKIRGVQSKRNALFESKNYIIRKDIFLPGAVVMVLDDTRKSKEEPVYEGPFIIKGRNVNGDYILKGNIGEEYVRNVSKLKLVHPEILEGVPGELAVVEKILESRQSENGDWEYLVKWAKKSASLNQWVKKEDFNDLGPIIKFNKAARKVSKSAGKLENQRVEKLWNDTFQTNVQDQTGVLHVVNDDTLLISNQRWSSRLNPGRRAVG
jgi:hypothetical protein